MSATEDVINLLRNHSNIALPSPALHLWSLKPTTLNFLNLTKFRGRKLLVFLVIVMGTNTTHNPSLTEDLCKDHGEGIK